MERRTIITLEGVEYEAQLARVTHTLLGYEYLLFEDIVPEIDARVD